MEVVCPQCLVLNRVPDERLHEAASCGRCQALLLPASPLAVRDERMFLRLIEKDGLPVLVDAWASWCGPCRQFAPVFEALAQQTQGRLRCLKLDTEALPHLAARYAIRSIPTLLLFQRGRLLAQQAGAMPAQALQQWLHAHLDGNKP